MDPNASFEELVAAVAERWETPTKAVGAGSRGRTKRSPALSPAAAATATAATAPGGDQQQRKQYKRSSTSCGLRKLPEPPGCRKCKGNARGCRIKDHQLEDASDEQAGTFFQRSPLLIINKPAMCVFRWCSSASLHE